MITETIQQKAVRLFGTGKSFDLKAFLRAIADGEWTVEDARALHNAHEDTAMQC